MSDARRTSTILSLFEELLSVPSPSGREERLADIVRTKVKELGYSPETDNAGNVIVRLEGRKSGTDPVIFAAHMDEIGMVITSIEDDGRLRVAPSGHLVPCKMGEGPVEVVGDGEPLQGVFSFGSTHVPDESSLVFTWKEASILTGLSKASLQEKGVRPGSTAVPIRERRGPIIFGPEDNPLVGAWIFDDRAGVAVLLELLKLIKSGDSVPARPTIIAFTVTEEENCHGAKVLAHRERPEIFIAVDGCPIPPGSPLLLDGRPGIWSKDRLAHFDQELVRTLIQCARDAGTDLQPVVYDGTYSDASQVYNAGGASRIATLGFVRENSHGFEVARLSVFDNMIRTLGRAVEVL